MQSIILIKFQICVSAFSATVGGAIGAVPVLVSIWPIAVLVLGAVNLIASPQRERNVAHAARRPASEATAFVWEMFSVLQIGLSDGLKVRNELDRFIHNIFRKYSINLKT